MRISHAIITLAMLSGIASLPALAAEPPTPPANGDTTAPEKTTGKNVRKEVREAVDSIKSYSVDKRDEAVQKAKAALDDFDARMKKWEQSIQENKEKAVAKLKEKRQQVAKRYEELKNAAKENWEKAKSRFLKDYQEIEEEYEEKVDPFLVKNETKDDAARVVTEAK